MRKGSRIINYIPIQFKDRAKVVRDIENEIRGDGLQFQTRVKVGLSDLELWKKAKDGNHRWERVTLPRNLPPVDLSRTVGSLDLDAMSPPPGRPGGMSGQPEKRDRESTGSESDQNKPKVSRASSWSEAIETADLVGEATISPAKVGEGLQRKPDHGTVLSVTGTPSKLSFTDNPASPILSRSAGNRNHI